MLYFGLETWVFERDLSDPLEHLNQRGFNIPDLRNIIGINITKTQWETIIALANDNFVQKYPTYLAVIDKEYLEDDDGKAYTSLNLAITGYKLQNENLLVNTLPADINLITYGIV